MSTAAAAAPARARPRSQTKLIFFAIFFAITAFVIYMKNSQIFDASSDIARHFAPGTLFLIPHAIFAGLALVMGAFQFSNRLRGRYLRVHRITGYVYIVCVMIGAPIAVPLAARIDTPSLVAASAVQAFGWILCTGIALYCIRSSNVQQHRRWMIRGYPFAMVFTVARLIIPIPPVARSGFVGIEIVVWTTIALAAFLPSLVLEWGSVVSRPISSKKTAGQLL